MCNVDDFTLRLERFLVAADAGARIEKVWVGFEVSAEISTSALFFKTIGKCVQLKSTSQSFVRTVPRLQPILG